ncbi:MAG: hypothetical protein GVY10_00590 [Verrucomicrobia bacterium]|jgi:hypothetical protein|nr:hypothetical protein [Verrucomicrobiota bacterium]
MSLARLSPVLFLLFGLLFSADGKSGIWPSSKIPPATDKTSARILALHLASRGGENPLWLVRSLRLEGTLQEGRRDFSITRTYRAVEALHETRERQHLGWTYRSYRATDGSAAWERDLLPERTSMHKVSGLERDLLLLEAALPFLFLNYEEKGHRFVYRGEVRFAGRDAYLLHGYLAWGMEIDLHIDRKTFRILNYRHPVRVAGEKVLADRMPLGLRKENGLWWETGYDFRIRGASFRTVRYTAFVLNPELPPELFRPPESSGVWLRKQGVTREPADR